MKILILDDDHDRHTIFAKQYAGHELTHVFNVAGAQAALSAEKFDLVSLDHDLGEVIAETQPDGNVVLAERTGYDVVLYLVSEVPRDRWPGEAIVHSWNAPKGKKMVATLKQHGQAARYCPFFT